jgi:hypothetical protein
LSPNLELSWAKDHQYEERYMRKFQMILLALVTVLSTSCATIVNGKKESVTIRTTPSGAKVLAGTQRCYSPCTLELNRGQNYTITLIKKGYQNQEIELNGKELDGWLWGNIVLGGLIGLAVDFGSGSAYSFEKDNYQFPMKRGASRDIASDDQYMN